MTREEFNKILSELSNKANNIAFIVNTKYV